MRPADEVSPPYVANGAGPEGRHTLSERHPLMPFITTKDGAQIFYKDWGPRDAQPIVFHHGWPLSADTTVAVTAVRARPMAATRWTPTQPMLMRW